MPKPLAHYLAASHSFARHFAEAEAEAGVSNDLRGACMVASAHLSEQLTAAGIKHHLVLGYYHVYVRTTRRVLDPTAEQFGLPGPYLGLSIPTSPYDGTEPWQPKRTWPSISSMVNTSSWRWDVEKVREYILSKPTS